jgi:hypothetical protein
MRQIETSYRAAPVAAGSGARFSSLRRERDPEFMSQLLAGRQDLSAQRLRRQATPHEVLRVYDEGGRMSVKRLPPGSRYDRDA